MRRGFSLIEIAIVLVVIGLLASGSIAGLSPLLANQKIVATNKKLDAIQQALVLYVIQNGCLPCPTAATTTTGLGTDSGSGTFNGTTPCGSGSACTVSQGPVPWVTLSLAKDDVIDPYNSYIDYAPSPGESVACNSVTPTPALTISSTSMVRTPPSTYPCGTITIDNLADAAAANATHQTTAAAYVLISHGPDRSGAYDSVSGKQLPDPNSSTVQACNIVGGTCPNGTYYVSDITKDKHGTTYFDDIVRYVSAPVIIQACGTNACGNPA